MSKDPTGQQGPPELLQPWLLANHWGLSPQGPSGDLLTWKQGTWPPLWRLRELTCCVAGSLGTREYRAGR